MIFSIKLCCLHGHCDFRLFVKGLTALCQVGELLALSLTRLLAYAWGISVSELPSDSVHTHVPRVRLYVFTSSIEPQRRSVTKFRLLIYRIQCTANQKQAFFFPSPV